MFSADPSWHKVLVHSCGSEVVVFHVPSADTHLLSLPTARLLNYIHSGYRSYADLEAFLLAENADERDAEGAREYLDSALAQLLALDLVQEVGALPK